jgi:hypothetical protein
MLLVSNPVQFCSTVIGRVLLEWYMHFEDYCCFLAAYEFLLPAHWREENVRIRQNLAQVEYPRLSETERIPRILDDIWAEFLSLMPTVSNVLSRVPELKKMEGQARFNAASELDAELYEFEQSLELFLNSPHVLEALSPAASSSHAHGWRHVDCCPHLPFTPHLMQHPGAGIFRIRVLAFKCYIWAVLYPPIQDVLGASATEIIFEPADTCSFEVCKTFAGLEDSPLGDNPDNFLTVFASLVLATTTCPLESRLWLWHKFLHFEKLGHLTFDPMKRKLASLWNMPEIISEKRLPTEDICLPDIEIDGDYIQWIMKDVMQEEVELSSLTDESGLEPLTRARGLYGLSHED